MAEKKRLNRKHRGTDLIISTVITRGISNSIFVSGIGLPVGIALSGTSLFFFLLEQLLHENLSKCLP